MAVVDARIVGVPEVLAQLEALKRSARNKHVRRGVNEGTKLLLKAAKAKCPQETGLLKKSLGRKVKVYRAAIVGLVGPRRGYKREVRVGRRTEVRDPAKYAHLAEKNRPFLRPALSEAPAVVKAVAAAMSASVQEAFGGAAS